MAKIKSSHPVVQSAKVNNRKNKIHLSSHPDIQSVKVNNCKNKVQSSSHLVIQSGKVNNRKNKVQLSSHPVIQSNAEAAFQRSSPKRRHCFFLSKFEELTFLHFPKGRENGRPKDSLRKIKQIQSFAILQGF